MANADRASAHALISQILESPEGSSFYDLARRIECAFPEQPRVGHSTRSTEDPVQFCQEPSLKFAPTTVHRYHPSGDRQSKPRLMANFMGLLGPHGPMPLHITEYVRDRELNHDDHTLARFLDIFNHRMVSLFYRAWAASRQTVSYDRRKDDRFSSYIGSFAGLGTDSLQNRDVVPDTAKLHFSGHLACQTRHAEGLCSLLQEFFGIQVKIKQFVGQWITIPETYRCRLGESPETGQMGVTAMLGSRVWECQRKFRIQMGPMSCEDYERLLPEGKSFSRLCAWVKNYVGFELAWDVQLVLRAAEVPQAVLGQAGRLGWSTWLKSRSFEKDAGDAVFRPPE